MLKLKSKRRTQVTFSALLVLTVLALGIPLVPVQAADGAVGAIQISNQIFHVSGSVVSVQMFDLTVSADYLLNWTGDDTGISFTTSSTQTKFTHTFVLTSSSSTVTFFLRAQSAGTTIDQVQATVVSLNSFLSTGLIISAGIFILIVVIFKRIAKR